MAISNAHRSPRNRERPVRAETRLIILHTTEGHSRGALQKLQQNGEAHFLVDEAGRVFRIIDTRRVAYHCGLSMWEGRTNLDRIAIGIEVAGYHNRETNSAQIAALRDLLNDLKRTYRVPDDRVLTHSMVAYGRPNQWHRSNHRGRKRCGMQFARWSVRRQLGLMSQPRFDPDVRAGRLIQADPYLANVLYGTTDEQDRAAHRYAVQSTEPVIAPNRSAWDIARDRYNEATTLYRFPDGSERRGNEITNWRALPPGTQVILPETRPPPSPPALEAENDATGIPRVLGEHGNTPVTVAGNAWNRDNTWYRFPDGRLTSGDTLSEQDAARMPTGTRVWIGYSLGGPVTTKTRAFDICGTRWNAATTFYLFPDGSIHSGNRVDAGRIPVGTRLLYRR